MMKTIMNNKWVNIVWKMAVLIEITNKVSDTVVKHRVKQQDLSVNCACVYVNLTAHSVHRIHWPAIKSMFNTDLKECILKIPMRRNTNMQEENETDPNSHHVN